MGGCNRCQMINTSSVAGTVQRSNEPLATLASYRRFKVSKLNSIQPHICFSFSISLSPHSSFRFPMIQGKIYFGILLRLCDFIDQDAWISVGQEIIPNTD